MKAAWGKLVCWFRGAHVWRRRRKGEAIDSKTCTRCGAVALVKVRAKGAA